MVDDPRRLTQCGAQRPGERLVLLVHEARYDTT